MVLCLTVLWGQVGGSSKAARYNDIRTLIILEVSEEIFIQSFGQEMETFKKRDLGVPDDLWTTFIKTLNYEELIELMLPIYDKHYTHEEIRQLIKFYNTPLGKKYSFTLPTITRESSSIILKWINENLKNIPKDKYYRLKIVMIDTEKDEELIPWEKPYITEMWIQAIKNLSEAGAKVVILGDKIYSRSEILNYDFDGGVEIFTSDADQKDSFIHTLDPNKLSAKYPLAYILDTEKVDLENYSEDIDWMDQFLPQVVPDWIEAIKDPDERLEMLEVMGMGANFDITKSRFYDTIVLLGY